MEKKDVSHCFLCAELKCFSKLIHLQTNEEIAQKLMIKLSRLNISCVEFDDEKLTKMICLICVAKLDKAFEFVSGVEKAQVKLKDIYKTGLQKGNISIDDREGNILENLSDCSVHIKPEDALSANSNAYSIIPEKNCGTDFESSLSQEENKNCGSTDISLKEFTWNDYLWTCVYCETQFACIGDLKTHSMQYHQSCNAFKCYDCNVWKMNLKQFIVHVKSHRENLKVICYKCNHKFMFACHLHIHMKTTHASKTNYVCRGCDAEFESPEELSDHNQAFYKNKRRRYIPFSLKSNMNSLSCSICNKSFKAKKILQDHLLTHTERQREYICERCGKCFLNKYHLTEHEVVHNDIRPHQCKICNLSFKTSKHLREHVGIHNAEKPYMCDQCGREFRLKSHLNSHKIVHTDSLPHVCSYCNKKFRFRSVLHHHLRQHTGEKPYACKICIRNFTNWPNYNVHMKRLHNLDMAKKKRTPEGVYPINPSTGKIIKHEDTNETLEWKKQILKRRAKGRPSSHKKLQINALDCVDNDKQEIK